MYTQLFSYTPFYNEFRGGAPIQLEYGIIYKNFSNTEAGGGIVVQNRNQLLVQAKDGQINEATIIPFQGNYSETAVQSVSIELEPGILQSQEFEDITLTVPTKLDEGTWEDILAPDLPPENVVVDEEAEELTLVLDGVWKLNYAPIGVTSTPASGERGAQVTEINPASPGNVQLTASERIQSSNRWTATFNTTGATTNLTEARISFYSGGASTVEDMYHTAPGVRSGFPWDIKDDYRPIDPPITLEGGGTETQVSIEFDDVKNTDEFFVITFILESGEQSTYFIG